MPRYSIRLYYQYVDEYYVEAKDLATAELAADTYEKDTCLITRMMDRECVDYDCTYGNEIDAEGHYTTEPEEL